MVDLPVDKQHLLAPPAQGKPARRWLIGGLVFSGVLALLSTWLSWILIRPWVVSIKPGEPLLVAQMPDRQGLVSGTGITAIAFEWESVRPFNHLGLAQVQRGNKHGWINRRGEMVIPCEYDSANDFRDDYWIAQKKGKTGILDQHGNTLIPFDYESIGEFDREGYAPVKRDDRWGSSIALADLFCRANGNKFSLMMSMDTPQSERIGAGVPLTATENSFTRTHSSTR